MTGRPTSISADQLREADFERCPVWRFRLDAEGEPDVDESHVQPAPDGLYAGDYGSFMVQARYELADGRQLPGAVQVDILGPRVSCSPTLLYAGGKALDASADDIAGRIARITKQPPARPVRWTLLVKLAGESRPRSRRMLKSKLLRAIGLLFQLLLLRVAPRGRG